MKRTNILLALACLVIPGIFTLAWFYSGTPQVKAGIMPDFPTIDIPKPPLSTAIPYKKPPEEPSTTVLFDMSHGNLFTLSEIDPFVRSIESNGGAIRITSGEFDLTEALKSANAFVTLAPLQAFTPIDVDSLASFVRRGGILVVASDPTRNMMVSDLMPTGISGVDVANLLLEPYDAAFVDDYLYDMTTNEGNYRNVIFSEFSGHELTKGVGKLVVYGGHSINSHGDSITKSSETTYSSSTDLAGDFSPFSIIKFGEGSVLLMGDLSLLTTQYSQISDNQVFVQNLAGFLTRENREKTLSDFPRVFKGDVVLIPGSAVEVDSNLLMIGSKLEKIIGTQPGELSISEEGGNSKNIILITTFDIGDESKDIIKKLKIDLSPVPRKTGTPTPTSDAEKNPSISPTETKPEDSLTFDEFSEKEEVETDLNIPDEIEIPGLSVVSTKDLGVVGLVRDGDRTTLLIMASSPENLKSFVEELTINSLSGCLIKDNLAACKVTGTNLEPKG